MQGTTPGSHTREADQKQHGWTTFLHSSVDWIHIGQDTHVFWRQSQVETVGSWWGQSSERGRLRARQGNSRKGRPIVTTTKLLDIFCNHNHGHFSHAQLPQSIRSQTRRLRIDYTRLTDSYLLNRQDQPECSHCDCASTVAHVLLECNHCNVVRQRYFNVSFFFAWVIPHGQRPKYSWIY